MEYLIHRQLNCTNIERRVGMASQHWVLWPELVVAMRFADGIRIEHREVLTYIENANARISRDASTALEVGESYTINMP